MTVYDRDLLEAIRTAGRELHNIGKELSEIKTILKAEKAPKKVTFAPDGTITSQTDLTDLESYFERMEEDNG